MENPQFLDRKKKDHQHKTEVPFDPHSVCSKETYWPQGEGTSSGSALPPPCSPKLYKALAESPYKQTDPVLKAQYRDTT